VLRGRLDAADKLEGKHRFIYARLEAPSFPLEHLRATGASRGAREGRQVTGDMDWPYTGEIDSVLVSGIWDLHRVEVHTIYEVEPGERYGVSLSLDLDLDLEILVSAPSSWDLDAR